MLAVQSEFCQYEASAALLPELIATGTVEEITAAEYFDRISLAGYPTT